MVNKGVVINIDNDLVTIRLFKELACSHCSNCGEEGKYSNIFKIKIKEPVSIGDFVSIEMEARDILKAASLVYMLPPLSMIIAYIILDYFSYSEKECIIGSFLGLLISFAFLFIYDRKFAKKNIEDDIKVIAIEKPGFEELLDSCSENYYKDTAN